VCFFHYWRNISLSFKDSHFIEFKNFSVRHRVKLILELLNDDELLRNERRKAKADGREKYQGFSKDDMLYRGGSNSSKFDSFERWNEKKVEKDEREEKQKEWKSTSRSGSNSARREVTAFDFDTADNSRSRASGSPELGIREVFFNFLLSLLILVKLYFVGP